MLGDGVREGGRDIWQVVYCLHDRAEFAFKLGCILWSIGNSHDVDDRTD